MKVVKIPLNKHTIVKVKPSNCLHNYSGPWPDKTFKFDLCEDCSFYHKKGDCCAYRKYTTEVAEGKYQRPDGDEDTYVQWNCGKCGELISLQMSISYLYYHLHSDVQVCQHCGTAHRYLEDDDGLMYTFAVPVK